MKNNKIIEQVVIPHSEKEQLRCETLANIEQLRKKHNNLNSHAFKNIK